MARQKDTPLKVKARRLALPITKRPTFESLGDGISIGYRRNQGAGVWVARRADGKGGKFEQRLGLADDYADADGTHILSWAQAQAKAFEVAPMLGLPPAPEPTPVKPPTTVATALDKYEADLKTRGGDAGNVHRLRLHVGQNLLDKAVTDLSSAELKDWRDGLAGKLAPATVNRTSNAFKAALNLAADNDDRVLTRNAWEKGLKALPDAEEARNVILTDAEITAVVNAAYKQCDQIGRLVEVAAVTGARYVQICRLVVGDLQDGDGEPRLMMPTAKKGKGIKKFSRYAVPIPISLAKKLRQAAGDRPVDAPLLLKPQRPQTDEEEKAGTPAPPPGPWRKSDHYRPFSRAAKAAYKVKEGEEPKRKDITEVTIYSLRHSSIVRQLLAAVPVRVVAAGHDTSVAMIEKNYSKQIADHSDALVRAAMLDMGAA
jgi:integrase